MEVESRRKNLLVPIRDLADNWSIDLATELEDYLHELEGITISFDGGETNVNFAEAALLIQGSACVYSRKVEYLYSLLYRCLEAVVEKKRKQGEKSSISADGVDADAIFNDMAYLLPLDDHIKEGKNIDLDDSKAHDYEARRAGTLLNRGPPSILSNDDENSDEIQFQVTNCVVHSSGALLFGEKDGLLLDHALRRIDQGSVLELPFGSPQALSAAESLQRTPVMHAMHTPGRRTSQGGMEVLMEEPEEEGKAAAEGHGGAGDDRGADDDMGAGDDMGAVDGFVELQDQPDDAFDDFAAGGEGDGEDYRQDYGQGFVEEDEERDGPDPWATVDPHEEAETKPRPFRKGKCSSVPAAAPAAATGPTAAHLLEDLVNVIYTAPAQSALRGPILQHSLKAPYFPEFSGAFVTQLQQQRQRQQAEREAERQEAVMRRQRPRPPQPRADQAFSGHDHKYDDDDDDNENNLQADDFDFASGAMGEQEEVDPWVQDAAAADGQVPEAEQLALETYEDLCRQQVDLYQQKASKYMHNSQLTRRVSDWQDKLLPKLEEESKHAEFDIHAYGKSLMTEIMSTPAADKESSTTMDFHAVMKEKPRYEVCRYFLAALQLANNLNVELSPSVLDDVDALGSHMNSMKLDVKRVERTIVHVDSSSSRPGKRGRPAAEAEEVVVEQEGKENQEDAEVEKEAEVGRGGKKRKASKRKDKPAKKQVKKAKEAKKARAAKEVTAEAVTGTPRRSRRKSLAAKN